jgi:hypothetical protein
MTPYELELEALERDIDASKKRIAFAERVTRLLENPDFRAVIMEEYIVQEAARLVQQSVSPALNESQRKDSLSMAQATGHLKQWLQVTQTVADTLRDRLGEMDSTVEELRIAIANGETGEED